MQKFTVDQAMRIALQHYEAEEYQQAEKICRAILEANPDHGPAWNLLSILAYAAGQNDLALDLARRAIAIDPASAEYQSNLGNLLRAGGQPYEALTAYRRAIEIAPHLAAAHNNLGSAFTDLGGLQQAIACHQNAIRLNPGLPQAHSNLGNALVDLGKIDEAIASYQQAILINSNIPEVHVNLAISLLLRGDYAAGWPEYEWRWGPPTDRGAKQKYWSGEVLDGRTILIRAEQGLGDTLQFVRYIPLLKERGGKIVVECQAELIPLLRQLPAVDEWIPRGHSLPTFDFYRPLLSLPMMFNTSVETIPPQNPPLEPPADRVEDWRSRLTGHASKFKVGLAWAGRPEHKNDRNRSIAKSLLSELVALKTVQFFSLQKGPANDDAAELQLVDFSDDLHDFADTAALISLLDLVICVDTSVAHLAGAMGKAVWLLLPFAPDWRWMLDRVDSRWYPTMRLFRQNQRGDWAQVIHRVAVELEIMAK